VKDLIIILFFIFSVSFVNAQGGAIMPRSNRGNWCENQKVGCTCHNGVDFWRMIIDKDFIKHHPRITKIIDTNNYKGFTLDTIFNYFYGNNRIRVHPDSIIKYFDNKSRKELFSELLEYVTNDSAKIIELNVPRRDRPITAWGLTPLYQKLIVLSKYIKNDTTLHFLKEVVYKSKDNGLVSNAALVLIERNEKELAFNTLKKLWYQKNDESYNYRCHEGFKALNNSDGISFLKFAALDSIVCVSFDACVKLIELGYKDYSKPIIEKHLNGKYRLISIYLLLKHYYSPDTVSMITDFLIKSEDEKLKYCGGLLLKKYRLNIPDYF